MAAALLTRVMPEDLTQCWHLSRPEEQTAYGSLLFFLWGFLPSSCGTLSAGAHRSAYRRRACRQTPPRKRRSRS